MKTLLKNGLVINVFTGEIEKSNVLIEGEKIIGVGNYTDLEADIVEDVTGKYICPGFIDGHIHIESTMLLPAELARVCVPHGTTSIVADPHEISNVCGTSGISFMLEASNGIPLTVYIMLPSCVPSTKFDESGATLEAGNLIPFYENPRVIGLAEMMNYPGVLSKDPKVLKKINDALSRGYIVDGHAPLISGKDLDKYISAGISDDHECSSFEEAKERIRKGQWIMIRQGTAARNLQNLLPLFEHPYAHRCLLVTDDKNPADLLNNGHIDSIIRQAVKAGKSAITGIQMATIQAAQCFGLNNIGAVAPGYKADILVLNDIDTVDVCDVYRCGKKVVDNGKMIEFKKPFIRYDLWKTVRNSFYMKDISVEDFKIKPNKNKCRVIKLVQDELLTDEWITDINWDINNGVDIERDILKLAVVERHLNTGHIGLGFISGIGLKKGAIASSISHDSHNLILIGTNDNDMLIAANHIKKIGGGNVVVVDGKVVSEVPLPIAGLMTECNACEIAEKNRKIRQVVHELGIPSGIDPFMSMAFVSLSVIPSLKMTTRGLVDVNKQELVSLFVED